ncbi:MAG: ATPase with chaperone activity [Thiomonas sp.]
MMAGDSQLVVPPSFIALFLEPHRTRPTQSREVITARYEFCEDLATLLTEHAADIQSSLHVTEDGVLQRVYRGLRVPDSGVDAKEAQWVVNRLAELLGWPLPGDMPPD